MVKLVDVRTELMGADMLTKAVGPAVLALCSLITHQNGGSLRRSRTTASDGRADDIQGAGS